MSPRSELLCKIALQTQEDAMAQEEKDEADEQCDAEPKKQEAADERVTRHPERLLEIR